MGFLIEDFLEWTAGMYERDVKELLYKRLAVLLTCFGLFGVET
jgi:hypothetical protein